MDNIRYMRDDYLAIVIDANKRHTLRTQIAYIPSMHDMYRKFINFSDKLIEFVLFRKNRDTAGHELINLARFLVRRCIFVGFINAYFVRQSLMRKNDSSLTNLIR